MNSIFLWKIELFLKLITSAHNMLVQLKSVSFKANQHGCKIGLFADVLSLFRRVRFVPISILSKIVSIEAKCMLIIDLNCPILLDKQLQSNKLDSTEVMFSQHTNKTTEWQVLFGFRDFQLEIVGIIITILEFEAFFKFRLDNQFYFDPQM